MLPTQFVKGPSGFLIPSPHEAKKGHRSSGTARVVGSATAAVAELFIFHPVDTVAKRLMSCNEPIIMRGKGMGPAMTHVAKIIFRDAYPLPWYMKYIKLFPGFGFAFCYKVCQRVYKFGGQPFVKDLIYTSGVGPWMREKCGDKHGKAMVEATAGCLIGLGEVVLLPFDVLKIKSQVNPQALKGKGLITIFLKEGRSLYAGTGFTMIRNAPGSFALFGGNAFTKEYIYKLKNYADATFMQTFVSSTIGATCSILVASPFDVVKTRIQKASFGEKVRGTTVVWNMFKKEGPQSFFKGITPKLLTVGPKLVFSFTVAQMLIDNFDKIFPSKPAHASHPAKAAPIAAPAAIAAPAPAKH